MSPGSRRGRSTTAQQRKEEAKESKKEVEKGTTSIHVMRSLSVGSPRLGETASSIGSAGRSLELVAWHATVSLTFGRKVQIRTRGICGRAARFRRFADPAPIAQ